MPVIGDDQLRQAASELEEGVKRAGQLMAGVAVPAPLLYDVLASLKLMPLDWLVMMMESGLRRSLEGLDVAEDDGGDPAVSVEAAAVHLADARAAAIAFREALESTQSAISKQSARPKPPAPGFCAATPLEIAQKYAAGEISREQLIDELSRWPFLPRGKADPIDGLLIEPDEGTIADLGVMLHRGLIDAETYDAIGQRMSAR